MENKRFYPLIDKLFWIILVPTSVFLLAMTVFAVVEPSALWVMIPTDLLVAYFVLSPLFGYVELRDKTLFIKFGFIMKKEIPYEKIRGISRERKFYSDSMMSLKNSFEHLNVKYNTYDMVSISVKDSEDFVRELGERRKKLASEKEN